MIEQILRIADREKNVLIVEFTPSHGELIYSQLHFLKRHGMNAFLFIHEKNNADTFEADSIYKIPSGLSQWNVLKKLKAYIKKNEISKVIFNTAHGLQTRNAILFLYFKKIEFFGIIHQAEKLLTSFTQKIISSKIKKYFTLSDHILKYFEKNKVEGISFSSFYPIYFPYDQAKVELKDKFIICIPGGIEFARKAYLGLIEILKNERENFPRKVLFRILGNASTKEGRLLKEEIDKNNLTDYFELYDEFLPNRTFFELLNSSNVIAPLIQPGASEYKAFLETSISGAFNLAFYSQKVMIMHSIFEHFEEFKDFAFFYNDSAFTDLINKLISSPELIQEKEKNIIKSKKFNLKEQANKYVSFIQGSLQENG
jgi:hypothetical protein